MEIYIKVSFDTCRYAHIFNIYIYNIMSVMSQFSSAEWTIFSCLFVQVQTIHYAVCKCVN